MAKSISSPWLEDTVVELSRVDTVIDALDDNASVGSKANNLKRFIHTPKVVQILSCDAVLRMLCVSDGQHSINVFYTRACEEVVENVGAQHLKFSMIKLKNYHISTTVIAAGDREQDKLIGKISFPFAILCKEFQYIGGHDLEKLGNPVSVNISPAVKMIINQQKYPVMVKRLAMRQFKSKYLVQADGEEGVGDEIFSEDTWSLTREHLFHSDNANNEKENEVVIIAGSLTNFQHSEIVRLYMQKLLGPPPASTAVVSSVVANTTNSASTRSNTRLQKIEETQHEDNDSDTEHHRHDNNNTQVATQGSTLHSQPYDDNNIDTTTNNNNNAYAMFQNTLQESDDEEEEDQNDHDLLQGQVMHILPILPAVTDTLVATPPLKFTRNTRNNNNNSSSSATSSHSQVQHQINTRASKALVAEETLRASQSQQSSPKKLSGSISSVTPINTQTSTLSGKQQLSAVSAISGSSRSNNSSSVKPSYNNPVSSYQHYASQLEQDFQGTSSQVLGRHGLMLWSPPMSLPATNPDHSQSQLHDNATATNNAMSSNDSQLSETVSAGKDPKQAHLLISQSQQQLEHNLDPSKNSSSVNMVQPPKGTQCIGQKIAKYSEGLEFREIHGIVRDFNAKNNTFIIEFETGEIQQNVPIDIASYNFVMDDDASNMAGSADWSMPYPPPNWPLLTTGTNNPSTNKTNNNNSTSSSSSSSSSGSKDYTKNLTTNSSQNNKTRQKNQPETVTVPFVLPPSAIVLVSPAKITTQSSNSSTASASTSTKQPAVSVIANALDNNATIIIDDHSSSTTSTAAKKDIRSFLSLTGAPQNNTTTTTTTNKISANISISKKNSSKYQSQLSAVQEEKDGQEQSEDEDDMILTQPQAKYQPENDNIDLHNSSKNSVSSSLRSKNNTRTHGVHNTRSSTFNRKTPVTDGHESDNSTNTITLKRQVDALLAEYDEERSPSPPRKVAKTTTSQSTAHTRTTRNTRSNSNARKINDKVDSDLESSDEEDPEEEDSDEEAHAVAPSSMMARYLASRQATNTNTDTIGVSKTTRTVVSSKNADADNNSSNDASSSMNTATVTKLLPLVGQGFLRHSSLLSSSLSSLPKHANSLHTSTNTSNSTTSGTNNETSVSSTAPETSSSNASAKRNRSTESNMDAVEVDSGSEEESREASNRGKRRKVHIVAEDKQDRNKDNKFNNIVKKTNTANSATSKRQTTLGSKNASSNNNNSVLSTIVRNSNLLDKARSTRRK